MFQIRFGSFFGSFFAFFKPISYRFKGFSGAISFCRHAALRSSNLSEGLIVLSACFVVFGRSSLEFLRIAPQLSVNKTWKACT